MEKSALIDEIKSRLGIQDDLAEAFANQVARLKELQQYFEPGGLFFSDIDTEIERILNFAAKALQPDKNAYRITFVGPTGAGKSQLINALLGRPLILTLQVESVTGVPVEIFFHHQQSSETVCINLRSEKDTLALINKFNEEYGLNKVLPEQVSTDFAIELATWELTNGSAGEERNHRFRRLRNALANMVTCQVNNYSKINTLLFPGRVGRSFNLMDSFLESPLTREVEEHVSRLINENDVMNRHDEHNRPIDLIQSVTYRINLPTYTQNQLQFQLPPNVCLVDLPGLTIDVPVHNLIFTQGVNDANVIIITLDPNRLPPRDSYLYNLIFNSNLVTTDMDSPKSIFLVINRWDEFQTESRENVDKLHRYLEEVKGILRLEHDYKTSAFIAFNAQLYLQNQRIETPDKYSAGARLLGSNPEDYEGTLEKTNIPDLVADVMEFVHSRLIMSELTKGRRAINTICEILQNRYVDLSKDGPGSIAQAVELVNKCQRDVEDILRKFHNELLHTAETSLRLLLKTEAQDICAYIDRLLARQDKMPALWKQCLKSGSEETFIKPSFEEKHVAHKRTFLGFVEVEIWKELPQHMTKLSKLLMDSCRRSIESKNLKRQIVGRINALTPSINAEEAILNLDRFIDEIEGKIDELSKHVVLLRVLENDVAFIDDSGNISSDLENAIDRVPSYEDLPSSEFRDLIRVIRSRYESVVTSWSVDMLMNFYQFQLGYMRASLLKDIEEFFLQVRGRVYNPDFRSEMLTMAAYPDQEAREALIQKREVLGNFCISDIGVRDG